MARNAAIPVTASRLTNCSSDRLVRLLTMLGEDVEIVVRPRIPRLARLVPEGLRLDEAHRLSHVVKDQLMVRHPQIGRRHHPHRAGAPLRTE